MIGFNRKKIRRSHVSLVDIGHTVLLCEVVQIICTSSVVVIDPGSNKKHATSFPQTYSENKNFAWTKVKMYLRMALLLKNKAHEPSPQ